MKQKLFITQSILKLSYENKKNLGKDMRNGHGRCLTLKKADSDNDEVHINLSYNIDTRYI